MIDFLKGLFFVRKCTLCGEVLQNADGALCPKCRLEFEKLLRTPCGICGKKHRDCHCLPKKLQGQATLGVHLFAFDEALSRKLIYDLKHSNHRPMRRFLAERLAQILSENIDLSDFTVTYAPRKPKSIREYGFDQAELLAEELAKCLDLPMEDLFCHARFSKLQKNLGAAERAENAEKSYFLRGNACAKTKRLLIVDDVITTGSTMAALADLAKMLGFAEIVAVSVAKTPQK